MSFNPFSPNNPSGFRINPGVTPLSPLGATPCQTPQLQPSQQTPTRDIDMEEDPSESQIKSQQSITIKNTASGRKQSHWQARKFKGNPFPEWFLLVEIFEKVVATGVNQLSLLSLNGPAQINAQEHPSRINAQPTHPTKTQNAANTSQSETSAPRVHCAGGQTSTGSQIALALKDLVAINQPGSKKTQGAMAMKFFQENDTNKFDDHKQLAIFNIFYSERCAAIYMSIERKQLQITWLQQAILQN
ncbi:hypothetical protein PCANC_25048 [Puccinia coronata f. sp. avenae]|uniref:Uncharacterized protein n=1 Tax=Puccinia coronata f. sp. avenae TaxID=200324 RepID=A0A2N5U1J2_9BASI|nr:hypothetical protein PCANC_25048 [Puccinia coronata f. sp. avenae]